MNQKKFIIAGIMLCGAIIYLIVSSTIHGSRYYLTIDELYAEGEAVIGRPVQVIGVVDGDSIWFEADARLLRFTMEQLPADGSGLEAAAEQQKMRLDVIYHGIKPDLLQPEAQVIVTGRLGVDGSLYADELLFKCPARYQTLPTE